jgi:hypothetical protein
MSKKLLVLEFNELCPEFIDRFIDQGYLPNFKALREESTTIETLTDATGEDLNPWVQWADVHTGLERGEHGLFRLNEANKCSGKFTWDILGSKFKLKSWICGSMNASVSKDFVGRFLPDPWSFDSKPFPSDEMGCYYKLVSKMVQGHSDNAQVSPLEFIKSLLKQGIGLDTISKLVVQLIREKLTGDGHWKRAMHMDNIQFDLFKYYYEKENPDYATFFSNSVAHYQHHYWRDFEPQKFGVDASSISVSKKNAILASYQHSDSILGKARKLVGGDCAVIFATALSQKPYTESLRYHYHINSLEQFLKDMGASFSANYKPVMAAEFAMEFPDDNEANKAVQFLENFQMDSNEYFHVGNNQLFLVTPVGEGRLHVQCRCTKNTDSNAMFFSKENPNEFYSFSKYFYEMGEVKAGVHSPIGLYWFYRPSEAPRDSQNGVKPSRIHQDILEFFDSPDLERSEA